MAGSRVGNVVTAKKYDSPMDFSCQTTTIVYLTDGLPTEDVDATASIDALPGTTCAAGVNPKDANDRNLKNDQYVWVETPSRARLKVKTQVTERVGAGTVFMPFHFSGWWMGKDMLEHYPEGAAPVVRGEAINTATTYGYDIVTMMQETKTTLCQVSNAA